MPCFIAFWNLIACLLCNQKGASSTLHPVPPSLKSVCFPHNTCFYSQLDHFKREVYTSLVFWVRSHTSKWVNTGYLLSEQWVSERPANPVHSSEAETLPNQAPRKEQERHEEGPECTWQEKGIMAGQNPFSHLQSHCLLTRMGWWCGRPCWLLTRVHVLQPDPRRSTPVVKQVQFIHYPLQRGRTHTMGKPWVSKWKDSEVY